MLVWILIISSWVALLSLILHDATIEDSDGSAIWIAAKKIKAFTFLAMLKARKLRRTLTYRTSQANVPKSPVKVATAVNAISSSLEELRLGGPSVNGQAPALPPKPTLPPKKKKWRGKDHRLSMTTSELEMAISEAVKKAAPGCEDFVGVIVRHKIPKSHRSKLGNSGGKIWQGR